MSVEFNDEQSYARAAKQAERRSLPDLLVKYGLAKNEKDALVELAVLAIGCALVGGILFLATGPKHGPSPQELRLEQLREGV